MSSFLFVSVLLLTPLQISASAYASTSGDCETGACTPQIDDTIAMIQSKTKVILDAQMSKEDTMSLTKSSVVGVSLQEDGQNKLVATQKMEKAMQTAVEEMVTNGRGSSIPSSVLDSIVAEMEAMAANLVKEHANFQQQIYDASTVVKNCNTNKETTAGPGGSVAEAKGSMEERNTTHDTCRTAEQIAYNDKNSTCTVMAQMSDASCKAAPKCTCETNPECDVVSVLACFEEHSRWIASGAESLKAQKVDCDAKTTSWSSKADECDTDQENYEIAFCSYAEHVDTMCTTLETCYAQALAAHESTDSLVKEEEKELKILMASAKKIVCFLSVIQKGSSGNVTMSDYKVCKNLNVSSDKTYLNKSTEDMVITYEEADDQAPCEPIINTPGDGSWAATEYAKYNQDWLRETAVCLHKTTTTTTEATCIAGFWDLTITVSHYCNLGGVTCVGKSANLLIGDSSSCERYSVIKIPSCSKDDSKCDTYNCGAMGVLMLADSSGSKVHAGTSDGMLTCGNQAIEVSTAVFQQATTTAAPTTKCKESEGDTCWVLVLQYGGEPYTPTSDAVGIVDESTTGFAKLSDEQINSIAFDDAFDYFMLTSDKQSSSDRGKLFVRTPLRSFKDTQRNMGWGKQYDVCVPQDSSEITSCSSWSSSGSVCASVNTANERFDTQCRHHYTYDCTRWFMDYTHYPQCYNPRVNNKRCLSGNSGCGSPAGAYGIRTNFRLYKRSQATTTMTTQAL